MVTAGLADRPLVAVCGGGVADSNGRELARETGRLLAEREAILICGGLGGVMAAAARGAKEAGGLTIGILPGTNKAAANPYIDLALATGLGHVRNTVIVRSARGIIALPGKSGTLSEIAFGLTMKKPVIGLQAWNHISGVILAATPAEAVDLVLDLI